MTRFVASSLRDLAGLFSIIFLLAGSAAYIGHRVDVDAERRAAHDALMLLESEIRIAQEQLASVPVSAAAPSAPDLTQALTYWRAASQDWASGHYAKMRDHIDQGYGALRLAGLALDLGGIAPSSAGLILNSGTAVAWVYALLVLSLGSAAIFVFFDARSYEFRLVTATSSKSLDDASLDLNEKIKQIQGTGWEGVGVSVQSSKKDGEWTAHALLQR